jgi:archaeosine-15-forming tRNA-guanine transglycosylase
MSEAEEQIAALKELRKYVVWTRRSSAIEVGDKDLLIKNIIQCQEAIRAIDEAIAEEEKALVSTPNAKQMMG